MPLRQDWPQLKVFIPNIIPIFIQVGFPQENPFQFLIRPSENNKYQSIGCIFREHKERKYKGAQSVRNVAALYYRVVYLPRQLFITISV